MQESDSDPDWTIDLNQAPPEPRTDPRLPLAAAVIRSAQAQLSTIVSTMNEVEDVIRDCAANGMTRDEIAVQCSLAGASVDRVLAGGTLFGLPR